MKTKKTEIRRGLYFSERQEAELKRICELLDTESISYAVRRAISAYLQQLEQENGNK